MSAAAAKKRPARRRSKKKAAAPRTVTQTIVLGDDVLTALDDLESAGVFPPRLARTRVARIRWLVINFARCHARLFSAHALAVENANAVDAYVHALAPLAAKLRRFDSDESHAAAYAARPDSADLDFSAV